MDSDQIHQPEEESRAPFFGSWGRIYALVIANLVVLILLFYLFTLAFNE